jgi:hypothetical protein
MLGNIQRLIQLLIIITWRFIRIQIIITKEVMELKLNSLLNYNPWFTMVFQFDSYVRIMMSVLPTRGPMSTIGVLLHP